jgi:hypothetical protein
LLPAKERETFWRDHVRSNPVFVFSIPEPSGLLVPPEAPTFPTVVVTPPPGDSLTVVVTLTAGTVPGGIALGAAGAVSDWGLGKTTLRPSGAPPSAKSKK